MSDLLSNLPHPYLAPVIELARRAGEAILPFWRADVEVMDKADASPVTAADLAAHPLISFGSGQPDLAPLAIQFADFSAWKRSRASEDARYWRDRLIGDPPLLLLPADEDAAYLGVFGRVTVIPRTRRIGSRRSGRYECCHKGRAATDHAPRGRITRAGSTCMVSL